MIVGLMVPQQSLRPLGTHQRILPSPLLAVHLLRQGSLWHLIRPLGHYQSLLYLDHLVYEMYAFTPM